MIVRRPDEERDDFYIYENGLYTRSNRNRVKSFIRRYVPVGLASDNMINNVYNLMLCNDSNICTFKDLDTDENYINLQNGLYNLRTRQLDAHTPTLYITTQLDCEYHPEDNHRPAFDGFINDLCTDHDGKVDYEKKAVIQEFTGMILSSKKGSYLKLCMVLWSLLGNTGKTQYLNLLTALLGDDKVANIPIQNMNEESKFSMGSIVGKRLISIGDQTSSEIKDSSIFKQLTGGDPVKVEAKGKQPFYYEFPGVIVIACNNLPSFKDDKGGHVFERLQIIPCINTIEKDRRDSLLLTRMLKEKNAIFNWALEGLHRLISNGFKITKSVACEDAVSEYREKLDTIYRYLSEAYIVTGNKSDMVRKIDFDSAYTSWCLFNEFTPVNKQNIKDRMEANGCPVSKANMDDKRGVMVYRNLKQKNDGFESLTSEKYTNAPFLH